MKKYRTKPWAKGLACGLFVLAMTVSVICLGNVRWLAYHGGYQWEGTRQLVEEEEAVWVENLTNQLADGYRSYRDGDQSLDVKRYVEDENFFFTHQGPGGKHPSGQRHPGRLPGENLLVHAGGGHGPMESY